MPDKMVSDASLRPQLAPWLVGVSQNTDQFIAEKIFPPVEVFSMSFKYETWDNSALQDEGDTTRGTHTGSKILKPPAGSTKEGLLQERSAKIPLDVNVLQAARDADSNFPAAAGRVSHEDRQRLVRMKKIVYNNAIQKEKAVAAIVNDTASYDAALQTSALSFKTAKITDLQNAMREVQRRIGVMPDTLVLGWLARQSLNDNDNFLDRVIGGATVNDPATVSDEWLMKLLGIKRVVVGMPVLQSKAEPGVLPATTTALWDEDNAALIYSGNLAMGEDGEPSFGKVFYRNVPETGVRFATWAWPDDEPNTVEWQKAAEYYLVAQTMKAGYLFVNVDQ